MASTTYGQAISLQIPFAAGGTALDPVDYLCASFERTGGYYIKNSGPNTVYIFTHGEVPTVGGIDSFPVYVGDEPIWLAKPQSKPTGLAIPNDRVSVTPWRAISATADSYIYIISDGVGYRPNAQ
jgi:hypothetical protein